ncbi:MAG TPA: carboxypeptidase regulatory-like domain-containing protein [Saprospiraceae bacterium]|nr:carboxypeptidase regulatory-like domain-containing protein [Saprospiraceae bacterium]
MRYLILCLFFLFTSASIRGQVKAVVVIGEGRANEKILSVNWSEQDELSWKNENQDRLEIMALKTDLHSDAIPTSQTNKTSYSIRLQKNDDVEMLIEIENLSQGEELILKENESGKILYSSSISNQKKFLTPAFDPSTTSLEWITSIPGSYNSSFRIQSLYLHEPVNARTAPPIGFGTAMSCHPNAACKQDSILKLISNSAIRIRMVMDEGIGWCSGSFVNNVREDKTPYILLAYHCTFEYTPQYNLWRFDLEYKSDSCANPSAEPLIYSIVGCERKAGGQASDFLLVRLNENVPLNHQVTFAGWNHDDTTTPDTSYLIHHPNADIRKFSTCIDKAVIHPNTIGWTEGGGYTTPPNHHFRFKFTEGGHQPGSSGGPVFDQNGYLVAQLHGGSMGCEFANNAFVGRFSKSWNLGSTAEERLKDWLDPDNTGVLKLTNLENFSESETGDIHGTILDPSGRPVKNVTVTITGSFETTFVTDDDGQFSLNNINRNGQYHIVPEKDDHPLNGLNAFDIVAIQKHVLLKDTLDFSWQHIAADATNNNAISAGDIVLILKLILGKITSFPTTPSWRFDPPFIDVQSIPAGAPFEIQLQAIKIGDVNNSANPLK